MRKAMPDAASAEYFLLDMGKEKYGDSILCKVGGKAILIDGGHPGDFDGQPGSDSIPAQLEQILGPPPFHLSLLVVTHCHIDHIGCLPKMVKEGLFKIDWALVADEKLGWGKLINAPDSDLLPDDPMVASVVAALREEPRADDFEDDAALERFLSDSVTLEQQYKEMLQTLEQNQVKVVRYGRDDTAALVAAHASTGMKILGPTNAHLELCRIALAGSTDGAGQDAMRLARSDASSSAVDLYRRLAASGEPGEDALSDAGRLGAALNDQSIILVFGTGTKRVLLTGDMQFASPGVNGLDEEMTKLRQKVSAAGPYKVAKLPHHGSDNGFDDSVRQEWPTTRLFAISGGSKDPGHPAASVRSLLKTQTSQIKWARTDKNGQIEIQPSSSAQPLKIEKGQLNDSSVNQVSQDAENVASAVVVRSAGMADGVVEVTARIPASIRRVVITVETEPREASVFKSGRTAPRPNPVPEPPPSPDPAGPLASGRKLPRLLFLSNRAKLAANIGAAKADTALKMIQAAGQTYFDVSDPAKAFDLVRAKLTTGYEGVVLVGGYDVLPAQRIDTLPAELRRSLSHPENDADNFIVWSDSIYGDIDQDPNGLPEIPVSRIPDGKSAKLLLTALQARTANTPSTRFVLYNRLRPFAASVAKLISGSGKPLTSLETITDNLPDDSFPAEHVYFMLHGQDSDGGRFFGEEPKFPEAMDVTKVPSSGAGVVFSGCCWGALPVHQLASRTPNGRSVTSRTADESIALAFLQAGFLAFVGCTGSHYSPPPDQNVWGGPMHLSFWNYLKGGEPPSKALFKSKLDYLRDLPHGLSDPEEIALEHKILRQFTCLGLGW